VTTWRARVASSSAEATRELGRSLARSLSGGDTVLVLGTMGAGKTTLAQGVGAGLGAVGPITSPTFTLIRDYPCPGTVRGVRHFLHADVYRLESRAAIEDLGLAEQVDTDSVALVEWGEAAAAVLDPAALWIRMEPGRADDERELVIEASDAWADRRDELAGALGAAVDP
jgi:tRNA threonylcarbamoyladenosine biosynthesis protein TsaE